MDKNVKKIRKFIASESFTKFFCALTALGIFFIYIGDQREADQARLIGAGIIALSVIIIIIENLVRAGKMNKLFKKVEDSGATQALVNDFENGNKAFNGNLILGNTFIIGKQMNTLLTYGDISEFYESIHKTNGYEDRRSLKVNTYDGRAVTLCNIPTKGKADAERDQVVQYINYMRQQIAAGQSGEVAYR